MAHNENNHSFGKSLWRGRFRSLLGIIAITACLILTACSSATLKADMTNFTTQSETNTANSAKPSEAKKAKLLESPYTVAAVSAPSVEFNLDESIVRADEITSDAAAAGATLVAFGELWLPGFPKQINFDENWASKHYQDYVKNAVTIGSPEWDKILNIARSHKVYLSIGFAEREGNYLYMAQALIGPKGKVIETRRKVRPSGAERNFFSDTEMAGNLAVHETPLGRIGQLECWEHLHPQMTYPMHAQGENLHIAAWPVLPSDSESPEWWEDNDVTESVARYYAINGSTWVITPGVGEAFIMNPFGQIVTKATPDKSTDFIVAKIDPSQFANTTAYNSSGEYSWGVLDMISDTYEGPQEDDPEHGKLNKIDIRSVN